MTLLDLRTRFAVPVTTPWVTGRFYAAALPVVRNVATLSFTNNTMYACPVYVPRAISWATVAIEITTNPTGLARLGYYKILDDGAARPQTRKFHDMPGDLARDFGTVDLSSGTAKSLTINEYVAEGVYWLVVATNATVTVRSLGNAAPLIGIPTMTTTTLPFAILLEGGANSVGQWVTNGLPRDFPTLSDTSTAAIQYATAIPRILLGV